MRKTLLIITILSIQFGLNAQEIVDTIRVKQGTSVVIVLRDSLSLQPDMHLYGDVETQSGETVCFGGTKNGYFTKAWKDTIFFYRDSQNGVMLRVPTGLAPGKYDLFAKLAEFKGSQGWCPDRRSVKFVLKVLPPPIPTDEPIGSSIQSEKMLRDSMVIVYKQAFWGDYDVKKMKKCIDRFCKSHEEQMTSGEYSALLKEFSESLDSDDVPDSSWKDYIVWILLIICLIAMGVIFREMTKQKRNFREKIDSIYSELTTLKNKVGTVQSVNPSDMVTAKYVDDKIAAVLREVNNSINELRVVSNPIVPVPPVPQLPKPEWFDTLVYDFSKNIFIRTGQSQGVFVIKQVGGKYSFTFKNSDVCRELLQSMQMYSGCVSLQGNTANVNGIASIEEGELRPMGDNRSFSVAKPIIVSLK